MNILPCSFALPLYPFKQLLSHQKLLSISASGSESGSKSNLNSEMTTASTTTRSWQSSLRKHNPIKLPKPTKHSFFEKCFNAFDEFIINFIDPPLRPSIDPKHVLSGNFAPVSELPPTDCQLIHGTLSSSLSGVYIRNGPNPQHIPHGPHHLFDGDGMLHSIRISNGKATFCSRFIKTYKFSVEEKAGTTVFPNVLAGFNGFAASLSRILVTTARVISGQINPCSGIGLANTSLFYYKNRLYAMGEPDMPYALKVSSNGDITTIGRHDFDGKLTVCMTSHPKIDTETGEAFAFRFNPLSKPYLTYFRFDKSGSKQPDVPIFSMKSPSLLHDFAITKNYSVFAEMQLGLNLKQVINGGSLVSADLNKTPRIGVIPRNAGDESEMVWFEVAGLNMVHVINAWEEEEDEDGGTTVVLVAPNIFTIEDAFERLDLIYSPIEKVKINLKTGNVSRETLSDRNLDFGVINPAFASKKCRYVYAAIGDPTPKVSGIVKLDLSIGANGDRIDCVVACQMFPPGCFGGEPFFVPKEYDKRCIEEDEGYLVSYLHDENTGESRFLVMDAMSPTLEVVAAVKLPGRVPYGFHGVFLRESDLRRL